MRPSPKTASTSCPGAARDPALLRRRLARQRPADDEGGVDALLLGDERDRRLGALEPRERIEWLTGLLRELEALARAQEGEEARALELRAAARVCHLDAAGEEVREAAVAGDEAVVLVDVLAGGIQLVGERAVREVLALGAVGPARRADVQQVAPPVPPEAVDRRYVREHE